MIEDLVTQHYLSGAALNDDTLHRIYTNTVVYFGRRMALQEVSLRKAEYYRRWPNRSYALIDGTLVITWISANRAKVTFGYDYHVTSPRAVSEAGQGRALIEIDFSGPTARIASEGGHVLALRKTAATRRTPPS